MTEILFLPLAINQFKMRNLVFVPCLLISIGLKMFLQKQIENIHRRSQERAADKWSILKNNDVSDLEAFIKFRQGIIRKYLGSNERYERVKRNQLLFWKLRFTAACFLDPHHPFPTDIIPMVEKKLEQLHK